MTNYNDGKIHGWNGGECPVHPDALVKIWRRDGVVITEQAFLFVWLHNDDGNDIIAFRATKECREPKTRLNGHVSDFRMASDNERDARLHAASTAISIAAAWSLL